MNSVEYDLDTSGGLMPQIQALIAPPVSEESGKKLKKEREHRYRRPGRTVNHDCCDSCKEGGDLICCDRCPATFHLQCHDPPLSDDDLPSGEWICHRCKVLPDHMLSYARMEEEAAAREKSLNPDEDGGGNNKGTIKKDPGEPGESNRSRGMLQKDFGHQGNRNKGLIKKEHGDQGESIRSSRAMFKRDLIDHGEGTRGRGTIRKDPPDRDEDDEDDDDPNPFKLLIKAAACMNPKQFQLPSEMTCTLQLPGSNKRVKLKESNRNNTKKPAHELDNGIVSLPAKLCFQCRKSCRKAPLVQCDYCPLLFHADCLDPPLTSLPANRWMCPNHAEHILEEKLLTTVSLTERVKLWDHFSGHMSQDAIKVAFFNKVHRANPPFRCKRKHKGKPFVRVPEAIKAHYKKPPVLLPRVSDVQNNVAINYQLGTGATGATLEEQEHWLSSVVSLQTSIAKYLAQQQLKSCRTNDSSQLENVKADVNLNSPLNETKNILLNGCLPNENGPLVDVATADSKSDLCAVKTPQKTLHNNTNASGLLVSRSSALATVQRTLPTMTSSSNSVGGVLGGGGVNVSNSNGSVTTNSVCGVPTATSVLLPRPQLINATTPSPFKGSTTLNSKVVTAQVKLCPPSQKGNAINNLSSSPAILNLNSSLQSSIEGADEVELSKLDERLINILAWQRLQQLLPPKTNNPLKKGINGILHSGEFSSPKNLPPFGRLSTNLSIVLKGSNDVKARAVVCPLSGKGPSISMPYRTLTIGTGADMDVCLTLYGQCNYVSSKHACIFYDEITKHYELLNYSEHGTTVDNVLYSCDFSEKHVQPLPPNSVVSSVRKLTDKTRRRNEELERATMSGKAGEVARACNCKTSSSTLIGGSGAGWEGTALLHHGSYIKCGCLQFVFSITEYTTAVKLHDETMHSAAQ